MKVEAIGVAEGNGAHAVFDEFVFFTALSAKTFVRGRDASVTSR
jgi:hypothetical protein